MSSPRSEFLLNTKNGFFPTAQPSFENYQLLRVDPTVGSSFSQNSTIKFHLPAKNLSLLLSESFLTIRGKVVKNTEKIKQAPTTAGEPEVLVAPKDNPSLKSNFSAALFSDFILFLNSTEIEHIRQPGLVSSIVNLARGQSFDAPFLEMSGFRTDHEGAPESILEEDKSTFYILMPLRYYFSFLYDQYRVLRGASLELSLQRSDSLADVLHIPVSEAPHKNLVEISEMALYIPSVVFNTAMEIQQLNFLNTTSQIDLSYQGHELFKYEGLPTGTKSLNWALGARSVKQTCSWLFLVFFTDKADNFKAWSLFPSNPGIHEAAVWLDGTKFPAAERVAYDSDKCSHGQLYLNLLKYQASVNHNQQVSLGVNNLYTKSQYKKCPIFVFDLRHSKERVFQSIQDLRIEFSARDNFPAKTNAYAILVYDVQIGFNPRTQIISR